MERITSLDSLLMVVIIPLDSLLPLREIVDGVMMDMGKNRGGVMMVIIGGIIEAEGEGTPQGELVGFIIKIGVEGVFTSDSEIIV